LLLFVVVVVVVTHNTQHAARSTQLTSHNTQTHDKYYAIFSGGHMYNWCSGGVLEEHVAAL
jgi:hypothetical protein